MKTLPQNIQDGMAGDSRPVYLIMILPASSDSWEPLRWSTEDISLQVCDGSNGVGDGTTTFYDAGATFVTDGVQKGDILDIAYTGSYTVQSVTDETHLVVDSDIPTGTSYIWKIDREFVGDRIKRSGLGKISTEVDVSEGGNVAVVSDFDFLVLNQDSYFSSLPTYLENRDVEIRLIFGDKSNKNWSNTLMLWKGVVDTVDFDWDDIKFHCIDASLKKHCKFPIKLIDASYNGFDVPEGEIGKVIPVVFGEIEKALARYCDEAINARKFVLSDRPICSTQPSDSYGNLYFYFFDDGLKKFFRTPGDYFSLYSDTSPFTGEAGLQIKAGLLQNGQVYIDFYYPWTSYTPYDSGYTGSLSNLVDKQDSTLVNFYGSTDNGVQLLMERADVGGRLGTDKLAEMLGRIEKIFFAYKIANVAGMTAIRLYYNQSYGSAPGGSYKNLTVGAYNSLPDNYFTDTPGAGGADDLVDISEMWEDWKTLGTLSADKAVTLVFIGSASKNADLIECAIVFRKVFDITRKSNVFCHIDGRTYEDTWNGRKMAGYLIENPVDVIEAILRQVLGLGSSQINEAAFDTAHSNRSAWKAAKQVLEQEDTIKEIEKLCCQAHLIYYTDYLNREKVVALQGGTSQKSFTNTDIKINQSSKKSSLKITKTPLDKVFNEYFIHYKKNYATGEFEGLKFIKSPNASTYNSSYTNLSSDAYTYWTKCHNSYTYYQTINRLDLEADWIRDGSTAEALLKALVDWLAERKRIIQFTTWLNAVDVELGDIVDLTHTLFTGNMLVFGIDHSLNTDEITLRAREI